MNRYLQDISTQLIEAKAIKNQRFEAAQRLRMNRANAQMSQMEIDKTVKKLHEQIAAWKALTISIAQDEEWLKNNPYPDTTALENEFDQVLNASA